MTFLYPRSITNGLVWQIAWVLAQSIPSYPLIMGVIASFTEKREGGGGHGGPVNWYIDNIETVSPIASKN